MKTLCCLLLLVSVQPVFGAAVIDVSTLASGDGLSPVTAWSGWDAQLNTKSAGIELYFPAGFYKQTTPVALREGWTIRGAGEGSARIQANFGGAHNKSAFQYVPSVPTEAHLSISGISIENPDELNTGSGILLGAAFYAAIRNVRIIGYQYGIALSQAELVQIDSCAFTNQKVGIWIVNGDDYNPANADQYVPPLTATALRNSDDANSAKKDFTNRISVHDSQFNMDDYNETLHFTYGIADDGGAAHSFYDNNFVNGQNGIRLVSTRSARVATSYFENSNGPEIWLTDISFYGLSFGADEGANVAPRIESNFIAPLAARPAIELTQNDAGLHSPVAVVNNTVTATVPAIRGTEFGRRILLHGNNLTGAAMADSTSPAYVVEEK